MTYFFMMISALIGGMVMIFAFYQIIFGGSEIKTEKTIIIIGYPSWREAAVVQEEEEGQTEDEDLPKERR